MSVISNWVFHHPTTYVMKEKVGSWSGNDFSVKDAHGNVILKADGKVLSWGDNIKLNDAQGNHICTVKQEKLHLHQHFYVLGPDATPAATLRKKIMAFKDDIRVYDGKASFGMGMKTSANQIMQLKGSITGRNFTITDPKSGRVLAKSHEKRSNVSGWVFGKDEYEIEVAEQVDVALVLGCLIAMDCMQENSKNQ